MDHGAETEVIPWSSGTNWIIDHGSLDASIAVESSDCPILESVLEFRKSPLILKPDGSDSGPCEITIHFEQKFDICQIYVRSTARVYEIYYARTSHSGNEYLCTVRCGVAERDGKVLQTVSMEDVDRHRDSSSEELTEEIATSGGSTSNGEDDWIKIKIPGDGISSSNSDRIESMQDLYEATAEISEAEPCSLLTIRLLSLQDKGNLYVDEIYVFVDPAESVDSGNEATLTGSSTQSSLMAMMVPTLLQLSKSGVSQDKRGPEEALRNDKRDARSKQIDQIDVGLHKNQVQHVESKTLDKDTSECAEPQQPTIENNTSAEAVNNNTLPARNLEKTLEQLVSRVSRMEDIFLRFEEKMLRPIESIEARLQHVELQLEKLSQSSLGSGIPHVTGICAPARSCSKSNSNPPYNDKNDFSTCEPSEIEKKDLSCDAMPELPQFQDTKIQPGLVVSAPNFSYDEDEDDDDVTTLEDSLCTKPKKALSVDDALAAALSGFLSTALNHSSVDIKETSGSTEVDKEDQNQELEGLQEIDGEEFPVVEHTDGGSLQYTQVLSIKAPDFNADEIGNEDELKDSEVSLGMGLCENEEKGHDVEVASTCSRCKTFPFSSVDSYHFCENKSGSGSELENNGESSDVPLEATNNNYSFEVAKESVEADNLHIEDASEVPEKNVIAADKCTEDAIPLTSDSSLSSLNFDFPILDVKFASDVSSNPESPLEVLLYGSISSSIEPHPIHDCLDGSPTSVIDYNEATNSFPGSSLLVDIDVSSADDAPNMEGGCHDLSPPSSPTIDVSLI